MPDDYKDVWLSLAFKASCKALKKMRLPFFTIEELRALVEINEQPLDARWWGHVTSALKASGHIKKLDHGKPAKSSNYSMKPVWAKA
jgi:hypothetical protein